MVFPLHEYHQRLDEVAQSEIRCSWFLVAPRPNR